MEQELIPGLPDAYSSDQGDSVENIALETIRQNARRVGYLSCLAKLGIQHNER